MADRQAIRPTARMRGAALVALLDLVIVVGVAAHLAQGTAVGSAEAASGDPVQLLGTVLHPTSCPTALQALGNGMTVVCPDWTAIASSQGIVEVISLYGPDATAVDEYRGTLPQGLAWRDSIPDVWSKLGRPSHITGVYGTPMFVYTFDQLPYGSLELRFDHDDLLVRVNASRRR